MNQFMKTILLITILFLFWIEYTVGNVIYRINSEGKKQLNISSMINFMIHPLHNKTLWHWKVLDINYPFVLGMSILIFVNLNII